MRQASITSRLVSLDAARGFAVFAMVVAHTKMFLRPTPKAVEFPEAILNDVAAPLFALIIGVTFTVAGPTPDATSEAKRRFLLQTAIKALVLVALGWALDLFPSGVNVVLDYLGITMLLALPFMFARTRTLIAFAIGLTVIMPGVTTYLREVATTTPELVYPSTPLTVVLDWLVLGRGYQATTFLALVLIGIAIGRTRLHDRTGMLQIFIASISAFVLVGVWRVADLPGTDIRGGYIEVLREAPLAIGAFALIALLTDLGGEKAVRACRRIFEPLSVQGRMALSVYVLHVVVLMFVFPLFSASAPQVLSWLTWPRGLVLQVGLVVLCWAFSALWWRFFGTGPLERLLGAISGRRSMRNVWSNRTSESARTQKTTR